MNRKRTTIPKFKPTQTPPRSHRPVILEFTGPNGHNIAVIRSDKIIGFGYENCGYAVCLEGGGTVLVKYGQKEYEALKKAMERHL